jgi:cyclophilin family peptidyl-prolyl cis-trans isomerase
MMRFILSVLVLGSLSVLPVRAQDKNPVVVMDTSQGKITIELFKDKAPKTVDNFLRYVNEGFYDGTIFHRVIADFMIQGGGFEAGMKEKQTHDPIVNEADNGLSNERGTIAMARTNNPNSATAQFFINVKNNSRGLDRSNNNAGYAVFGRVIDGMDAVDAIRRVETARRGSFGDVPVQDVVIRSVRLKNN